MEKYEVQIIETASRIVTITASNAEMARKIAKEMYHDEEIVLDYDDYDFTEFVTINRI